MQRRFALVLLALAAQSIQAQSASSSRQLDFQIGQISQRAVNDGGIGGGRESFVTVDSLTADVPVIGKQLVWTSNGVSPSSS